MRILVLGSEGQIGKPFCQLAESQGHTVIRFDKKIDPKYQDLSNPDAKLHYVLSSLRPDVVVFLAFEVGGSKFLETHDKSFNYISENVRLMEYTFNALRTLYGIPVLFASSQMANMHHTNYGLLKNLGERYTKAIGGYICRFWNVYGYEDPKDPKSHVITDFIHMAKTNGIIRMRTTGSEERQFLHTDDCSKALLEWCKDPSKFDKSQYLDITSFEWSSIMDVAKIVSRLTGATIHRGELTDLVQCGITNQPSTYMLKFWMPDISLEEGIKKLL